MTQVLVDVHAEEVERALERTLFIISPTNISAVLHTGVVEYLQDEASNRFDDEGTRARGPWDELTEATQNFRDAAGFPPDHPINIREGELFGLMTEDRGEIFFGPTSATLSWPHTNDALILEKLRVAQDGKSDPFTPARPVLEFDAIDAGAVVELFHEWINEQMSMFSGVAATVTGGMMP